ncbi:hypothetical protein HG535_0B04140 [Zygotorulaspora mrakii]|uniref:Large ribosomal subunit protein bL32m n=1 Tax=Zygotorulaspora mrakii TaxID=42260 RepID=A0A7H9B0Q8_ZYGMR|nr:uncharacterized protein HG535_0B04140 [Zygotorulaspora mrakii]QLG71372.1 hypothetical protein HG535_0B04140 [Zygotorulaspora mrakii]
MSVAIIPRLLDRYYAATATTLLPWVTALGEVVNRLPKDYPVGLQQWLKKREEKRTSEQNMGSDTFWNNGILLAVPKKKVSHQKKRQKLYGPGSKQLKMIHHINTCPSCGHFKLANTLCTHCVGEVSRIWRSQTVKPSVEPLQEQQLSELDKRVIYPGKKDTAYVEKLKDKESYLERRMRSLPVDKEE